MPYETDCVSNNLAILGRDNWEVTSIIESLESGSSQITLPLACNVDDVLTKIDAFTSWLNSSVQGFILTSNNVTKCEATIAKLDTVVSHLRRQLKRKQKLYSENSYRCRKCGHSVHSKPNENLWSVFQTHEHIEEQLAFYLQNGYVESSEFFYANNESDPTTVESEVQSERSDNNVNISKNNFHVAENTSSNVIREPNEMDFKFNFIPQYDKDIQEAVYIPSIVEEISEIDKVFDYTIQYRSMEKFFCLLCLCPLSPGLQSIKIHAYGVKHMKNSKHPETLNSLHMYHTNFTKLESNYQSHQVYFNPESITKAFCQLCNTRVFYVNLKDHLLQERHRKRIFQMFNIYPMNVHSYLLPRQLALYSFNLSNTNLTGTASDAALESETGTDLSNCSKKSKDESLGSEKGSSGTNSPKKGHVKHNQKVPHHVVKSVDDAESSSTLGLLEKRFHDHLAFLDEGLATIICKVCNFHVEKDLTKVKMHLLSEQHKLLSKIPPRKYRHYCDVCAFKTKHDSAWEAHFKQSTHKNKLAALPILQKVTLCEFECLTCRTILYGDENVVKDHIANNGRIKKVKEIKLTQEIVNLLQSEEKINNETTKLLNEANAVIASQNSVWACCHALEEFLSLHYPKCKAYPFGSRVTGLGNKTSDLDVFVDIGDMYTGHMHQDAASQESIVKYVTKLLRKDQSGSFSDVFPIPKARTPIVQVFHRPTGLDCDLSFRHGLSVENTKFLKLCMGLQPATQSLILLVKKWSKSNKFDEHISTYALSMMVIFFMQVNNLLLPVKTLRMFNPHQAVVIDGWETINYKTSLDDLKQHIVVKIPSLKQMLKGFFRYYSAFKYETDVICPLMGQIIPKSAFHGTKIDQKLPPEMQSYIIKVTRTPETEHFRVFSMMCIQDPFDLSHNLTKACQPIVVERFKVMCELSSNILEDDKK